jgi:mannose-1-phosphate guanylyltransferase
MQAIVLVGGEGTRLRPLTLTQPKPAIRLVDRPFIRFMVDWLARHGVDDIVMACGFHAELLMDALDGEGAGGPRIRYVEEPEPLGTAGPIRLAADQGLLEDRFLALNGDVLADLDLGELVRVHERNEAAATLALYPVDDPTAYGLVRRAGGPVRPGAEPAAADGAVEEFLEKPGPSQISTDEISAGAYVLESSVLDLVPPGRAVSIEREVFPRLVGEGLYGQRLEGYWMDIGTPERYLQASWDILEGCVKTDVGSRMDAAGLLIEDGAGVDASAEVAPPALVEAGCEVGAGARIGPRAVIGGATWLAAEARVSGSVIDRGCRIGYGASVDGAILAMGVGVGDGAVVPVGTVVGQGAQIAPGARLSEGARVQPDEEVGAG